MPLFPIVNNTDSSLEMFFSTNLNESLLNEPHNPKLDVIKIIKSLEASLLTLYCNLICSSALLKRDKTMS